MDQTLGKIALAIENKEHIHHAFVNAATIVNLQGDTSLKNGIIHCDIINADGYGVILAAKMLGKSLPERVSGPDLMEKIVELAHKNNYKIFFLGAEQIIVEKVVEKYSSLYSSKIIA
jgi:N-acetylglucosaminyldiphosphoundecaprenol N-acetyl-beta-D-mannosaminyltransferase